MQIPAPEDVERTGILSLDVFAELLRTWRNHWADVERIARDFPEDVKTQTLLRPPDPTEALAETRAQFAVLFHPEAIEAFTSYLDIALRTVESLLDQDGHVEPRTDASDPGSEPLHRSLARLEQRLESLDAHLAERLGCCKNDD